MKLPIFDELSIKNYRLENLIDRFKRSKVGESPFYIDIDDSETPHTEIISNIESALKNLSIFPTFPYPLYIITKKKIEYNGFLPIINNLGLLPEYFSTLKPRRLKGKEVGLLNKVDVLSQKILNLNIYQIMDVFKDGIKEQRDLTRKVKLVSKLDHVLKELNTKDHKEYE